MTPFLKHMLPVLLLLLSVLFLAGCGEESAPPSGESFPELLGAFVCTPGEAIELTSGLRPSAAGVPPLFSHAAGEPAVSVHRVPCADAGKTPVFYLPLDPSSDTWDALTLQAADCRLYLVSNEFPEKAASMAANTRFRLLFCTDTYYSEAYLYLTGMPVLTLNLCSGDKRISSTEIGTSGNAMQFSFYDGCDPETGTILSEDCFGRVHIRGGTSRNYEKHSLKFSLYKDSAHGEQKNLSMCGLRRDDDWVLNALYQEETKVRDMLCYDLWGRIGADAWGDGTYCGTRMRYVEVILSGTYWGLYGLCEPEDAKQFGIGTEEPGAVYKVGSWDVPSTEQLRSAVKNKNATVANVELKYPDTVSADAWRPFMNYVEMVHESPDNYLRRFLDTYADMENQVNYWIFLNATAGSDNSWKNMYAACRYADGRLMVAPWDCDISFGISWEPDTYLHLYHKQENFRMIMNLASAWKTLQLDACGAVSYLKERWAALRSDFLTEEWMIAQAEAYSAFLYDTGAMQRNRSRWPKSGYLDNLDYLEDFIRFRLPYMDEYIAKMK